MLAVYQASSDGQKFNSNFIVFVSACENPEALKEQIPGASLSASSYYRNRLSQSPIRSRLTTVEDSNGVGAWPSWQVDNNQWIQADFFSVKTIFKISTKGRNELSAAYNQWVTKYQLKYGTSSNEADFQYVTSDGGDVITFDGNIDRDSVVENEFAKIFARVLRLCPTEWHIHISLRWEVYGC